MRTFLQEAKDFYCLRVQSLHEVKLGLTSAGLGLKVKVCLNLNTYPAPTTPYPGEDPGF